MDSPYDPIFADIPNEAIPVAFRSQLLRPPGSSMVSVVGGRLDRLWSRPALLRPLFWLMGRLGLIALGHGLGVTAQLTLRPGVDNAGRLFQTCDRSFGDRRPMPFVTRKVWEPKLERMIEYCGPGGAVLVDWDVAFHPPHTLTFTSRRNGLNRGRDILWLPAKLSRAILGVTTFTQIALDERTFHIEMVVRHPLLGPVFGYEGTCVLTEEPA